MQCHWEGEDSVLYFQVAHITSKDASRGHYLEAMLVQASLKLINLIKLMFNDKIPFGKRCLQYYLFHISDKVNFLKMPS